MFGTYLNENKNKNKKTHLFLNTRKTFSIIKAIRSNDMNSPVSRTVAGIELLAMMMMKEGKFSHLHHGQVLATLTHTKKNPNH